MRGRSHEQQKRRGARLEMGRARDLLHGLHSVLRVVIGGLALRHFDSRNTYAPYVALAVILGPLNDLRCLARVNGRSHNEHTERAHHP